MLRILPLFLLSIIASNLTFGQELAKGDPACAVGEEVRRLQDALIEAYIHRDVALRCCQLSNRWEEFWEHFAPSAESGSPLTNKFDAHRCGRRALT